MPASGLWAETKTRVQRLGVARLPINFPPAQTVVMADFPPGP